MEHVIKGEVMPVVELTLKSGEAVKCQAGAMKWREESIEMKTEMQGGLGGYFKRSMMKETRFLNVYRAKQDGARIAFGHTYPGVILPVNVNEGTMICQKRSFLLGEETVQLDIKFQQRLGVGFFGGEGFIMQKLHGTGTAFVEIDGEIIHMTLDDGQSIKVETGAVAMFDESVQMSIDRIKGVKNVLFGGEGMFLTTLTGPGRIWLQTMSIQSLARELHPFLPGKKS